MNEKIPKGWKIKRLGDLLISLPKSKLPSSLSNKTGYYNFYVCSQNILRSLYKEMSSPAVLFSTGGEAAVHYAIGEYSYSTDVWATNFTGEIYDEYVFRLLEKDLEKINYSGFQGSGIKHLDKKFVKNLTYAIPPRSEQKKILSILNSVDELIKKTEFQIEKNKNFKISMINKLLINGINNKKFRDTDIGIIPDNWKLKRMSDIADIIDPHPSHRAPPINLDGIPFVGIGDVEENGDVLLKNVRKVSAKFFNEHSKRYQLTKNTIGFGRVASIGKIIDFKNYSKKITISPTMAIIEPKEMIKSYLINILKSNFLKKQIKFLITGSTRSSLGIMHIRNLLVPVAPINEQKRISLILDSIDEVIKTNNEKLRKINFLKKSLMQDFLTGKLRVQVN